MGRALQAGAWLLGIAAILCLPAIPMLFVLAVLRPNRMTMSSVGLLSLGLVIAPFLLIPASLILFDTGRRWRHGGLNHGYCRRCGYDLRAARSDVCPECGTQM